MLPYASLVCLQRLYVTHRLCLSPFRIQNPAFGTCKTHTASVGRRPPPPASSVREVLARKPPSPLTRASSFDTATGSCISMYICLYLHFSVRKATNFALQWLQCEITLWLTIPYQYAFIEEKSSQILLRWTLQGVASQTARTWIKPLNVICQLSLPSFAGKCCIHWCKNVEYTGKHNWSRESLIKSLIKLNILNILTKIGDKPLVVSICINEFNIVDSNEWNTLNVQPPESPSSWVLTKQFSNLAVVRADCLWVLWIVAASDSRTVLICVNWWIDAHWR